MSDPPPPTGHGFNGANQDVDISTSSIRLFTAIQRVFPPPPTPSNPSSALSASSSHTIVASQPTLEARYQRIMDDILPGNEEYRSEMHSLCLGLQNQGEVPDRPSSDEVKDLFRSVPYPKTSTGKGSKGGMHHHECLWPGCEFNDTLQKCMDHLFSKHMKVKFYQCGINGCQMTFVRKFDCDKHKNRTHNVPRPRAARTPAPARSTRASARVAPY